MTTDPTATHHAQILDWLSAALTQKEIQEVTLTRHSLMPGRWTVETVNTVDPEKEATAMSQADADLLKSSPVYNLAGDNLAGTYPEWVGKADMDPDPKPYNLGGIRPEPEFTPDATGACQCDDCRDLEDQPAPAEEDAAGSGFNPRATVDYLLKKWGHDDQREVLLAMYGFSEEWPGVPVHLTEEASIQEAKEDLFREDPPVQTDDEVMARGWLEIMFPEVSDEEPSVRKMIDLVQGLRERGVIQ